MKVIFSHEDFKEMLEVHEAGCIFKLHICTDRKYKIGYGCFMGTWSLLTGAHKYMWLLINLNDDKPVEVEIEPKTVVELISCESCKCGGFKHEI